MSPDLTTSLPLQETTYMFQRLERVKERLYADALQYSLDAPQRAWYLQTTAEYLADISWRHTVAVWKRPATRTDSIPSHRPSAPISPS